MTPTFTTTFTPNENGLPEFCAGDGIPVATNDDLELIKQFAAWISQCRADREAILRREKA